MHVGSADACMRDVCRADVWGSMSRVLAGHGRSFCALMNLEASGLAKQVEKWINGQRNQNPNRD